MTQTEVRILFFSLIPVGIFLLIKGIKWIRNTLGGAVVLNIPLAQTEAMFTIPKTGNYAIWQTGKKIRRVAIAMPAPQIHNEETGEMVSVRYPFATVRANTGSTGKIRLFTFRAVAGPYLYQLSLKSSTRNTWLGKLRTQQVMDVNGYSIEIKENRPAVLLVFAILVVIVSAFCIITGLVFSLNSDAFLKN